MVGLRGFRHGSAASRKLDRILSIDQPWSVAPPPVPPEEQLAELHSLILTAAKGRTQDETRALYEHFPLLLRRLFGYSLHTGWLETVSEKPSKHRKALVDLIFPRGPIHQFCQNHFKSLLFEFPISNLPPATQKVLYNSLPKPTQGALGLENVQENAEKTAMDLLMQTPGIGSNLFESTTTGLARLLMGYMKKSGGDETPDHVTVPVIIYFLLCMLALPSFKVEKSPSLSMAAYSGMAGQYLRVPKRSTSLPSLRSLYNYLITGYIAYYKPIPSTTENIEASTFRAALSTYWLSAESPGFPTSATLDSLSCLFICSRYPRLESKRLNGESLQDQLLSQGIDHAPGYGFETNGVVLRLLQRKIFEESSDVSMSSLVGAVRLFCVLAFPWRCRVVEGARSGLLPLEKPLPEKQQSRIAWMNETLLSFGESIGEVVEMTRGGKSLSDEEVADVEFEKGWERFVVKAEGMNLYGDMLEKIITLAAESRIGTCSEGLGVLETLARGLQGSKFGSILRTKSRRMNLEDSVNLIAEHVSETRKRLASRSKPRSVLSGLRRDVLDIGKTLAGGLGIVLSSRSTGAFSSDWAHVWGRDDSASRRTIPAEGAGGQGSSTISDGLTSRKRRLMGERLKHDMRFRGSVWDQPIGQYENEAAVMTAYWISRSLENTFGVSLNLRWIGHYALWIPLLSVVVLLWFTRKLLSSIL